MMLLVRWSTENRICTSGLLGADRCHAAAAGLLAKQLAEDVCHARGVAVSNLEDLYLGLRGGDLVDGANQTGDQFHALGRRGNDHRVGPWVGRNADVREDPGSESLLAAIVDRQEAE